MSEQVTSRAPERFSAPRGRPIFGAIDQRKLGYMMLVLLLIGTFCLDIAHGVALGQNRVLFSPIYRLRQTLAVAISRLHEPPAVGYTAYGSVIDIFNANGFAILPEESGIHLDLKGWTALFDNGPQLNHILAEALHAPIDPKQPPDIIRGNELGFADYVYFAFRLFGVSVSSLYYFYYLLLGVSCFLYAREFRKQPFLLYLLSVYLGCQYFLQNYVQTKGLELNTVFNSRLLPALSLVAAAHLLFVLWQGRRPRATTLIFVSLQAALLAFIVSCRLEAMWQVLMLWGAAVACCLYLLLAAHDSGWTTQLAGRCSQLWPAVILTLFLFASNTQITATADRRYASEPETHIFWHELLMGILSSSEKLQQIYIGRTEDPYSDTMVYEAVTNDLRARGDTTSPGVSVVNGQINLDIWRGWGYYDNLVKSTTLKIVREHPWLVAAGLLQKAGDQFDWYSAQNALQRRNLVIPVVITFLSAVACRLSGGLELGREGLRTGAILMALFLAFASITPAVEPSALSVSSLFCYLAAIAVSLTCLWTFVRKRLDNDAPDAPIALPVSE